MMSRPLSLFLGIALATTGLGVAPAWANNDKNKTVRNDTALPADNTLPASVRRIERETGGHVLKAQPIQRDGREVYRVKVVTPQGRVRVVEDDAGPPPAPPPPAVEHERRR